MVVINKCLSLESYNFEDCNKNLLNIQSLINKDNYNKITSNLSIVKNIYDNIQNKKFLEADKDLLLFKKDFDKDYYDKLVIFVKNSVDNETTSIKNEIIKNNFKNKKEKLDEIKLIATNTNYQNIIDEVNAQQEKYVTKAISEIKNSIYENDYSSANNKLNSIKNFISSKQFDEQKKNISKKKKAYEIELKKQEQVINQRKKLVENNFFIGGCVVTKKFGDGGIFGTPILNGTIIDGNDYSIVVRVNEVSSQYSDKFTMGQNVTFLRNELFNLPCEIRLSNTMNFLYNNVGYTILDLLPNQVYRR